MKKDNKTSLSKAEKEDVHEFQRFLQVCGFKRIEGAIYGFLVLAKHPATAEEIGSALDLSQGAVSQGLGELSRWGSIESRYDAEKRAQTHSALQNNFKIVASIFRRREQDAIHTIKNVAQRALDRSLKRGDSKEDARVGRLKSIILTCETAEAVIKFVLSLGKIPDEKKTSRIVKALPRAFELLLFGTATVGGLATRIKSFLRPSEGDQPWL